MVSIIIPTYNREQYIKDCLDSALNQTYKNIEIICIDDGSIDSTPKILQRYQSKYTNIKVISQENKGVASARNTGINNMNGDYVKWLDSDDILYPNCIEVFVNNSKYLNHKIILASNYDLIDINNITRYNNLPSNAVNINNLDDKSAKLLLLNDFPFGTGLIFIHKKLFEYCIFDESLKTCEDYDLLLKLCFLHNCTVQLVNKNLIKGRHHINSLTRLNANKNIYVTKPNIRNKILKTLPSKEQQYYKTLQPSTIFNTFRHKFRHTYTKLMIKLLGFNTTKKILEFYALKIRHKQISFD